MVTQENDMGILLWIVFGALAGWAANRLTGDTSRGCLTNILTGIIGAFIGGLIVTFASGDHFHFGFNPVSFIVAVFGAIVLLALTNMARRKR
jgi:uncharacterized membrane protein YeaQ/YmgE (transglycosylase-associated protein family)